MLCQALDIFFTIFHILLILFNLTGWIWKKTRFIHLIVVTLTLISWLGLGYFYGWGYCFLTDWHYRILLKCYHQDLSNSYITFLIERLTGIQFDDLLIRWVTALVFSMIVLIAYAQAVFLFVRKK